jgi:ATP:cob(I)alamin adenosyltransferase
MSVTTKTGDEGSTSLWSGERVGKDDLRIECCGAVDELNAFIGDARRAVKTEKAAALLDAVQDDLFGLAGMLATSGGSVYLRPIREDDAERLTAAVRELEKEVPIHGFAIPGSTAASAKLDICRTVCRRAERRAVALARRDKMDPLVLRYLNRLSDALFMAARYEEKSEGALHFRK